MGPSFFQAFNESREMMLHSGLGGYIVGVALVIYGAIGFSVIAVFAARASAGRYGDQIIDRLAWDVVIPITAGLMILNYWITPIPGTGYTWPNLLGAIVQALCDQIHFLTVDQAIQTVADWMNIRTGDFQGGIDVFGILYCLTMVFSWFLEALAIFVQCIGYLIFAFLVVLFPLFYAFRLFPSARWASDGAIRSLIQYGTLPVAMTLWVGMIMNFVVLILQALPQATSTDYLTSLGPAVVTFVFAMMCLCIGPVVWNHIFSGSSGSGGGVVAAIGSALTRRTV